MSKRTDLLASIAKTIKDYRKGQIPEPTPDHVERWISQFPQNVQLPVLSEINHVLKKTYLSREKVVGFLQGLVCEEKLVGDDPCAFWRSVNFLDIQGGGNSQTEMLELFNEILKDKCGFDTTQCRGGSVYIYLDDGIFTGNRVRHDLEEWIRDQAPEKAKLHIVTIALHSNGYYYAEEKIKETIDTAGKNICMMWWQAIELENRRDWREKADVLWPTVIPNNTPVRNYVAKMKYKPVLRDPGNIGTKSLFSTDEEKILLEQELLVAGMEIRQMCPNLGDTQRPLGHMTMEALGFGSLIVTFRNCPNNSPLALWVDDPWYPLFPRVTNSQTKHMRIFKNLMNKIKNKI